MAQTYIALLFDLDGTLTDPKVGITRSVAYALRTLGIVEDDLDRLTPFIGPPLTESFQRYYGLDAEQALRALAAYREYFSATGIYENEVYPGMPALLKTLQARGARLFVATSKPTVYAERILAHFALDGYFARVVGSHLDLTRVAKTEIIAEILAMLPDVPRDAVAMIGDREHDVIGARNNAIDAIAVAYGYGSPTELEAAHPTRIVASVDKLARTLLG